MDKQLRELEKLAHSGNQEAIKNYHRALCRRDEHTFSNNKKFETKGKGRHRDVTSPYMLKIQSWRECDFCSLKKDEINLDWFEAAKLPKDYILPPELNLNSEDKEEFFRKTAIKDNDVVWYPVVWYRDGKAPANYFSEWQECFYNKNGVFPTTGELEYAVWSNPALSSLMVKWGT